MSPLRSQMCGNRQCSIPLRESQDGAPRRSARLHAVAADKVDVALVDTFFAAKVESAGMAHIVSRTKEFPGLALIRATLERLNALGVWGINGGLEREVLHFSSRTFAEIGMVKRAVTYDEMLDASIVAAVIGELGRRCGACRSRVLPGPGRRRRWCPSTASRRASRCAAPSSAWWRWRTSASTSARASWSACSGRAAVITTSSSCGSA
jgi:hypothetical protein